MNGCEVFPMRRAWYQVQSTFRWHAVARRKLAPKRHCSGVGGAQSLGDALAAGGKRRFFFIGGKGGVGKTTTAASLAIGLARAGRKTLVVSTDPAHSLGDALAVDLTGKPQLVPMEGIQGARGDLHALEINPTIVLDEFRKNLKLDKLREALAEQRAGLGASFLKALAQAGVDLDALGKLLELSPPGIDEAVALAQMMHLLQAGEHMEFERVVIDTAPTGHTLRLLSFPQFLHGLVAALLSIEARVSGFTPFSVVLGKVMGDDLKNQLEVSKANLERFMASMSDLSSVLTDAEATSFIVVAIPTHLAVSESRRLLEALEQAQMPAKYVIMNQCPFVELSSDHVLKEVPLTEIQIAVDKLVARQNMPDFSEREMQLLSATIKRLKAQHQDARKQIDLLEQKVGSSVRILCLPTFEEELTGVKALEQYSRVLFST